MSKQAIVGIAAALTLGWAVNLILVTVLDAPELYPLTAWPMYSGTKSEGKVTYAFDVVPRVGASAQRLPPTWMTCPKKKHDISRANGILRSLEKSQKCGQKTSITEIPDDMRAIWTNNAMHFMKLKKQPAEVRWVKNTFRREDLVYPPKPAFEQEVLFTLRHVEEFDAQ